MFQIWAWKDGGRMQEGAFGTIVEPNARVIAETKPDKMTAVAVFHPTGGSRVEGIYKHRSAEGHLSYRVTNYGGDRTSYDYVLSLSFKEAEDGKELYLLVRSGKIWPTISFKGEQVPSPFRGLRELGREAWGIVRREVSARYYRLKPAT